MDEIDDNIIKGNETAEEEENCNKKWDNNDEKTKLVISPVSTTSDTNKVVDEARQGFLREK